MGKVLLIIFAVVGGIVFAFGVLGLILSIAEPDANQSDEIVGAIFFMVVGALVAAPCIFFAYRMGARRATWISASSPALLDPAADLEARYLGWFAWCQQTLGGDAVSLNSAAMAAMTSGTGGENATSAASAEAVRQSSRIAASGAMPVAPDPAKIRYLARIGASTVGLLEPSERVLVSFWGVNLSLGTQLWGVAFGAIGTVVAASQTGAVFVTVTDRRVIALIGGRYGGLANRIALIESRSTVSAKYRKGLFRVGTFSLKGLGGGSVSLSVQRNWRAEAQMAIGLLAPSLSQLNTIGVLR